MTPAHTARGSAEQRLDEIDGLRAVAMTMVVAQHCGIAPFGWTGVWLFYCISGFVITRRLVHGGRAGNEATGRSRYMAFVYRRFFRIAPVYLLYLGLGASLLLMAGQAGAIRNMPFLLTFTFNWQAIFQWWPAPDGLFGPLWTLSVEEQFYLVFPLLFLFLPRHTFLAVAGVLILAGPLIRYLVSIALHGIDADPGFIAFGIYASSFTQFDAFLMGALVACRESWIRVHPFAVACMSVFAALAMVAYTGSYAAINYMNGARGIDIIRNIVSGTLSGQGREVVLYSALDLVWISAIMWTLLKPRLLRPLAWPLVTLVGRVSYGGYLYHALVIWVLLTLVFRGDPVLDVPSRIALFVVVWCATVALAWVTYRWFEMPIMAWANTRMRRSEGGRTGRAVKPFG